MTSEPSPHQPPRRTTWLLALAIPASLIIGIGIGGLITQPKQTDVEAVPATFTIHGEFTLTDGVTTTTPTSGECQGSGGYDDIAVGTQVTIYDDEGKMLAIGSLGSAQYDEYTYECEFDIAVANVPAGRSIYQIEVSHRGKIAFSEDEGRSGNVQVTLG